MSFVLADTLQRIQAASLGNLDDLAQILTDMANAIGADTPAELAYLHGVTAGTATASKAVVLGTTRDITGLKTITGATGTTGDTVTITGGTSSTTGNAGGPVAIVGGTPGATGVGGAITLTGAAGGATSGAGGAVTITGGAGTLATATGGAVSSTAGAGSPGATTVPGGVGGAASLVAGAGGAKAGTGAAAGGAGGAASLTAGTGGATASSGTDAGGAGGTATLTGGTGGAASAGTGAGGAGGNVNLAPGAGGTSSGGTAGLKGEVRVSNDANGFIPIGVDYNAPAAVAHIMYIATRPMRVKAIMGRVRVQGGGGACTANFFKAPSATALGSGTALEASGSFNFVGTADANQTMVLSSTASVVELAAGDSIGYVVTGTATSATGNISITLAPL